MKKAVLASLPPLKLSIRSILVLFTLCALASGAGCLRGGKPAEVPRSGKGEIVVTSKPEGAVVIFNGNPRGEAYSLRPVEIKGVDYGRHLIRAEFPGYVGQVLEVDVRAKKMPIEIRLKKDGAGRLVVRSNPPGAEVLHREPVLRQNRSGARSDESRPGRVFDVAAAAGARDGAPQGHRRAQAGAPLHGRFGQSALNSSNR